MLSRSSRFILSVFAAVLLAAAAGQAQKPALTKSVDEPGRTPYTSTVYLTCPANYCEFLFKPVPAGFRLVATRVSALLKTGDPISLNIVAMFDQVPAISYTEFLPTGPIGGASYLASGPITYFVEPGATPRLGVGTAQSG